VAGRPENKTRMKILHQLNQIASQKQYTDLREALTRETLSTAKQGIEAGKSTIIWTFRN